MLPGPDISMNRISLLFAFIFFFFCSIAIAGNEPQAKALNILAIVKDSQDSILEGSVSDLPEEATVTSGDNQEKKILSKYIKSITLEKNRELGPRLDPKQENRYSVRVENSQEIYTLQKKYTFSLNTRFGMVTRSIDPEIINNIIGRDVTSASNQKPADDKSLIEDKSVIFSLEFKF